MWYVVCPDVDIVIVHDAVRPVVDEECVLAVVNAAFEHGVSMICSLLSLLLWLTIVYRKALESTLIFCILLQ